MAKLTKTTAFKAIAPRAETPMDKTTRIVKKMVDDEAEKQQAKNARLRKARLEREACTPQPDTKAPPKKGATKASKAAKKR